MVTRPLLPKPAITYNQYLSQVAETPPEPYPNFFRKRIDQKMNDSKAKRFLLDTMIPMEEQNRRERKMASKDRIDKWNDLRNNAHAITDFPESGKVRLRKDVLRNYERRKRWGDIK